MPLDFIGFPRRNRAEGVLSRNTSCDFLPDGSWGLPTGATAMSKSPTMGLFFVLGSFL